jgi:hypothetical protein
VLGEEDGVEYQDQKGYRSLWEMLQGPVRDTVWAWSLADLETLMDSRTSSGVVDLGSLARVRKYDLSTTSTISITTGTEGSVTG